MVGSHSKKFNFFGQIFSQRIDRKSQKILATLAWPFGRDKCSTKVWVNLTPPPSPRAEFQPDSLNFIQLLQFHTYLLTYLPIY